jgi:hypothetical protein
MMGLIISSGRYNSLCQGIAHTWPHKGPYGERVWGHLIIDIWAIQSQWDPGHNLAIEIAPFEESYYLNLGIA